MIKQKQKAYCPATTQFYQMLLGSAHEKRHSDCAGRRTTESMDGKATLCPFSLDSHPERGQDHRGMDAHCGTGISVLHRVRLVEYRAARSAAEKVIISWYFGGAERHQGK